MIYGIEFPKKIALAYNTFCKPLCRELGLTQTAFDILMFLGNNPCYKTAGEIVKLRHLKANLVCINVNRLVDEGYLLKHRLEEDHRKTELICTEKAQLIIKRGRQIQNSFFEKLFADTSEETRRAFHEAMQMIEKNLESILKAEI